MTKTISKTKMLAAVAAMGAAAAMQPAHAIDVDAGDYTALPAGTNLGLVYYQHAQRNALYGNGNKAPGNNKLNSDVGILRGVHFMDIGGYIVDPQFLLPFGKLQAKGDLGPVLGSGSGVGDLILAATVWLTKPGEKTHFGITPFIVAPTGKYDKNEALNLGENRWKFILQGGYITPLSEKVLLDVVGDVTLFGKNKDAPGGTLKQDAQYQAQTFLRYQLAPTSDVRVGLSHTWGGETRVNGVDQNSKQRTTKYHVGFSHFLGAKTQVLATVGRDGSVENGFRENARVNLRLLQIF